MTKLKKKLTVCFLIFCLVMVCIAGALTGANIRDISVAAESLSNVNGGLQTVYTYGETVVIPENTITWEGKTYETEALITFPDGKTYNTSEIKLTETGVYTVEYRALVGKYYVYTNVSFKVENSLYTLGSADSYVYYGKHKEYENVPIGAVMQIAKGDEFCFNGAIDFSNREKSDSFCSFLFTPNAIGTEDVSRLIFRLTDIYDENNYIEIFCKQSPEDVNRKFSSYWTAAAYNQNHIGLSWQSPDSVGTYLYSDGNRYKIYENSQWGTPWSYSMTGTPQKEAMEEQIISVSLDYANKAVYFNGKLITDLDDENLTKNPWAGFSMDQAYLTVYSNYYSGNSLGLVFTEIGGYDLSMESYPDKIPPDLLIDLGNYTETSLPNADVGKGYKVFDATAYDIVDGVIDVSTSVWYNYGGANAVRFALTNGEFIPTLEGIYSIVYKATDKSGNLIEKILSVTAKNIPDIECKVSELNKNVVAGNRVKLFESLSLSNTTGNTSIKLTAIPQNDSGYKYEIDVNSYEFTPLHSGNYVLNIEVEDYVSTVKFAYDFVVEGSQNSVFESEDVNLPSYFIKGLQYTIPTLNVLDLSSGKPVASPAIVKITEYDGTQIKVKDGLYTPKTEGKASIEYSINGGEKITKTVTVVDTKFEEGLLDSSEYFQATKGRVVKELTQDYLAIRTNKLRAVDGEVKFEYINILRYDSFDLALSAPANKLNFSSFSILLNEEIKFSFVKSSNGNLTFVINDKHSYATNLNFVEYMSTFELNYNNNKKQISLNSNNYWSIADSLLSDSFNGFSTDGIYARFEILGLEGETEFCIYRLNGVSFYQEDYDLIEPAVLYERSTGDFEIGSEIVVKPAFAFDLFSPFCDVMVKVNAPDGSYVESDKGVLDGKILANESYKFIASSYGKYTVTFLATDIYGNPASYSYYVTIIDSEGPTVKILNSVTETKNGSFLIADIEASDNVSEQTTVYVNVTSPDGYLHKVQIGDTYRAEQKGTYTVTYLVFDESSNMTLVSYQVTVK